MITERMALESNHSDVIGVLDKELNRRVWAFLMGTHHILGGGSAVQLLPIDLLEMIVLFVMND